MTEKHPDSDRPLTIRDHLALGIALFLTLKPGARADVAIYDITKKVSGKALLTALGRVHTLIKAAARW